MAFDNFAYLVRLKKGKFLQKQLKWAWGSLSMLGSFTFIRKGMIFKRLFLDLLHEKIKFSVLGKGQQS